MPLPRQLYLALLLGSCACGTVTAARPPHARPTTPAPVSEATKPQAAAPPPQPARDANWYVQTTGGCSSPQGSRESEVGGVEPSPDNLDALAELGIRGSSFRYGGTGAGEIGTGALGSGVRGSLSKDHIREVIRSHLDDVRWCYEQAQAVWPDAAGRVSVKFIIMPDGNIGPARTVANETEVPEIGCCIATKVSGWTFDAPEGGGIVVVTYPFVLQGGTKD